MSEPPEAAHVQDDIPERITQALLRVINRIQAGRRLSRDPRSGRPLTMIEEEICSLISRSPNMFASELSERLGVTRSAVSQVAARLKAKGYILEEVDPTNAKRKRLSLSKLGEEAAIVTNQLTDRMTAFLYNEDPQELEAYLRFVSKLEAFHSSVRQSRSGKPAID